MSDRISLPIPKCTQQTRPFRSHSFNPPRTAPGSHRSRRTLSLPAREKPMIPPMIAESPESLRRSHDRYSFTEQSIQENVYEISWFAPIFGLLASIILFAWACALSISSHEMKKWFREKELRQSNTFLIDKTIPFIMYLLCWKRSAKPRQISACWNIVGVFLWYSTLKTSDRVFSRDVTPCWCLRTMMVSPANPPGIKLYSYAKVSFSFVWKNMHWSLFTSAGSTFISYSAQHMRKGSAVKGPHDHRPKEIEINEYLPAYDEAKIGFLASVFTV